MTALDAPSSFATYLRKRWRSAVGVMFGLFFLVGLLPKLLDPECPDIVPRLIFLGTAGPLITFTLSRHFDWGWRRRRGVRRSLVESIVLATVLGAAAGIGAFALATALGIDFRPRDAREILTAGRAVTFGAVVGLLQFVIWALSVVYPFTVEGARLRELEAETHKRETERLRLEAETLRAESEKLRATAELSRLRSQLEPHFLLNTLNAIAGLVTQRPKEARRLLGCMGDLLRDALHDPDEMQPLDDELTWLRRYAEILESRHAGALLFRWDVDDAALMTLVPRLLLQPLVENAVNHGALQRSTGGVVTIRVRLEAEDAAPPALAQIVCEIEDNGPGMPEQGPRPGAFGLWSVQRRLALKYEGASLRLESSSGGTRSIVRLPRLPRIADRPAAALEGQAS